MTPHPYLYEQLLAERHAHIQHEMQQSRMLAHAGKRHMSVWHSVGRFGTRLRALSAQLHRIGQRSGGILRSS